MKYLCLGYYTPAAWDALDETEQGGVAAHCEPHDRALYATGKVHSVASLAHQAVTIRPRGGKPQVTDGPYAEAKEVIGSFFIIEADSVEEATRIAALHPAANWGEHLGFAIEVRPIEYFREMGEEG